LIDRVWRENSAERAQPQPFEATAASEVAFAKIQELATQNEAQRDAGRLVYCGA
jgi:hypothetical protein